MARETLNTMSVKINAMVGNKYATPAAEDDIGDAINQARYNLALRNRDLLYSELEVTPPYYFQTVVDSNETATNTADSAAVTLSGTDRTVADIGQLFKYSGESLVYRIIDVTGTGAIVVSPNIATAHTAASCAIVTQRYPLPDGLTQTYGPASTAYPKIFHILDVTDTNKRWRLRSADARLFDRTIPRVDTDPVWYYRSGNNLYIHPTPDTAGLYVQVRYIRRVEELTADADVMDPIPEEFDRVILYEAASYILDEQMELERAAALLQKAQRLESVIRSKRAEEMEDYDMQFKPRMDYFASYGDEY